MILLYLRPNTSLNTSLQVGDAIYAKRTELQPGAEDAEGFGDVSGVDLIGYLAGIDPEFNFTNDGIVFELLIQLQVDDDSVAPVAAFNGDEFIMFSKCGLSGVNDLGSVYSPQLGGEVLGYYALTKLVNNSTVKAEIFSLGSEVIINSK